MLFLCFVCIPSTLPSINQNLKKETSIATTSVDSSTVPEFQAHLYIIFFLYFQVRESEIHRPSFRQETFVASATDRTPPPPHPPSCICNRSDSFPSSSPSLHPRSIGLAVHGVISRLQMRICFLSDKSFSDSSHLPHF